MNTFYINKKGTREEKAGITTTSEGENESLLSFFLSAGIAVTREKIDLAYALLRQARSKIKACFYFLGALPEKNRPQAGFTILFAAIIVSVITLLGATIAGIYQREARLRATSRASTVAFYAADSALECAMFYDRDQDYFSTSTPNISGVRCSGIQATDREASRSGNTYIRSFVLNSDEICAGVVVEKDTSVDPMITTIASRGRDTCNDSDRQSERALRTAY